MGKISNHDMHHIETSQISANMLPETEADLLATPTQSLTNQHIDTIMRTSQKLLAHGDLDAALLGLRKILQNSPDFSPAYIMLGEILNRQKKYVAAQSALSRALADLSHQSAERGKSHLELSYSLYHLGAYQKATLEAFKAVDLLPDHSQSHARLAFCLQAIGLPAEALSCTRNSLNLLDKYLDQGRQELYHALYKCQAYARLQQGHLAAGFANLSHAHLMKHVSEHHSASIERHSFYDQIVLVRLSGNHGENILLSRYLTLLKSSGALIILETPSYLTRLCRQLDSVEDVQNSASEASEIDHDISLDLIDLPYHLNISEDHILPAPCRFSMTPHQYHPSHILKVGIAWHSDHIDPVKSDESAFFNQMISLLDMPHIKLHSLESSEYAKDLSLQGVDPMIDDCGSRCYDAAELAEQILSLDLIISPDNKIAHLSASLGCPTWVLITANAHWAWGTGGMTQWYPKVRVFRANSPTNWAELFCRVHKALRLQASEHLANKDSLEVAPHNWQDHRQRPIPEAVSPEKLLQDLPIADIEESENLTKIDQDLTLHTDSEDFTDDLSQSPSQGAEADRSPVEPLAQESFIENKLVEILKENISSQAIEGPDTDLADPLNISNIPNLETADATEQGLEKPLEDTKKSFESNQILDSEDTLEAITNTDPKMEAHSLEQVPPLDILSLPIVFHTNQTHPQLTLKIARDDLKDPDIITLCRQEADYGGYHYATRLFLDTHLLPGDVFIDVGAHWGIYSLTVASKYPGEIKILAVEPHPLNLSKLASFMTKQLSQDIDLVATALADQPGKGQLSPGTSMSHYLTSMIGEDQAQRHFILDPREDMHVENHECLDCPVSTLDHLFAARSDLHGRRVFLKISTNGLEPEIIAGAQSLVTSGRVAAILWQRGRAYDRTSDRERLLGMMQDLQSHGYRHYRLPHDVLGGAMVPFLYGPELCTVLSVADDFQIETSYSRAPGKYLPPPRPSSNRLPEKVQGQWTELVKIAQTTDVGRWADPDVLKQGAHLRFDVLTQYVDPQKSVLDVGAGLMLLQNHMHAPTLYQPLDLMKWDQTTYVMDLNQEHYPDTAYDQIVIASTLEYLHHPHQCLAHMASLSPKLYLIYDLSVAENKSDRRRLGYLNDFRYDDLLVLLQKTGWSVVQNHRTLVEGLHLLICET